MLGRTSKPSRGRYVRYGPDDILGGPDDDRTKPSQILNVATGAVRLACTSRTARSAGVPDVACGRDHYALGRFAQQASQRNRPVKAAASQHNRSPCKASHGPQAVIPGNSRFVGRSWRSALHSSFNAPDQVVYLKWLSEQGRRTRGGGLGLKVRV
jgi:hypothetical protein